MWQNNLLTEAWNAVVNINGKIIDSMASESDSFIPVILQTDGNNLLIEFLGLHIWDDDNDDRDFNEEKNEYEPLEPFLIKKINEQLELIKSIKL